MIDSIALTVAYANLAATNGVPVRLGARVTAIRRQDDGTSRVDFTGGSVRARFVVNVAGVAAGAISAMAGGEELRRSGLDAGERPDAARALPHRARLRAEAEPERLVARDPLFGQVVCSSEHVSAAEINYALEMPVPATSVDGVRKRTGAGYGRCQGSLCAAGISFMTALHTGTGHAGTGPASVRQTARARSGRLGHDGAAVPCRRRRPSGLGFGCELARHAPVILLDRLPVTGGTAGRADADVRRFTADARRQGVELRLGESALRWRSGVLLVAAPGRFARLAGRHLIFAGGLRPATAANLNLTGDRPAGVLAGTAAEHLLEAGVRPWQAVVVLGDGPWARGVADQARAWHQARRRDGWRRLGRRAVRPARTAERARP